MTSEDTRSSAERAMDAAALVLAGAPYGLTVRAHGVSTGQTGRAVSVLRTGIPELAEAVRAGQVNLSAAERIARLDPADQPGALRSERRAAQPRNQVPEQPAPRSGRAAAGYTPRYRMTAQMDPRRHGLGVIPVVLRTWQQYPELVRELDPGQLSVFLADARRARQALSTLIHLIEKETER